MKKLMIATALCAAVSGLQAIESSNVVGYSAGATREGFKAMGSQFMPVSGTTIDLTDIKVTGYDTTEGSEDQLSVQKLDKNGDLAIVDDVHQQWYWLDVTDGDDVYYGWYDDQGDAVAKGAVTLAPADGLWVDSADANLTLQTAGQVDTKGTDATLRQGFKMIANPTPVAVDLTKLVVKGYDTEEGSEDQVNVQKLDKNGDLAIVDDVHQQWYWLDVTDGDDVYYGWYDDQGDAVEAGTVSIDAGEALWVDAPSTEFTLAIPGVTL